ncbi:MAG: hypothetical protein ACJAVZ_002588 [Afipia broomeae]|jgi:hypothetical protein
MAPERIKLVADENGNCHETLLVLTASYPLPAANASIKVEV